MKNFKFRTWDTQKEEFQTGYDIVNLQGMYDLSSEQFELELATAILDNEGKEIFEGDILENKSATSDNGLVGFVKYYPQFGYCIMTKSNGLWHSYRQEYWKNADGMPYKVIGNIHENKELLEVQ